MKRILLIVNEMGQFAELKKVASMLEGRYEPVFKFSTEHTNTLENINYCRESGYVCYDNNGGIHGIKKKLQRGFVEEWGWFRSNLLSKALHYIYWKLHKIPMFLFFFVEYERSVSLPNRVLWEIAPSLVILSEENLTTGSVGYIRTARKLGIPTLIVPFTISGHEEQAGWMQYYEQFYLTNIYNRIVGFLFSNMVCKYRGRKLLRLVWYECIVNKILRIVPPHPWQAVSGMADAVAVESNAMQMFYQNAGVDPMKLRLTGSLNDDILYEGMQKGKKAILKELGLPDKPTILVAFVPDHTVIGCPFKSYAEIVEFMVKELKKVRGWNIIIRPHPKTKMSDMEPFSRAGFMVSLKDTASLIPACDLYIASVSATIRWAIACGKPVINYDVYNLGYKDYGDLVGVVTRSDRIDFMMELDRVTLWGKSWLEALAHFQKGDAAWWGRLDGNAGERMMTLINQLVARKR